MATFYLRINYATSASITLADKYSVLANWSMDADGNIPATTLPTSSDDVVIKIYGSSQRDTTTTIFLVTMTHYNITIDLSSVVNTLTNAGYVNFSVTAANTLVTATNSFTAISYARNATNSENTAIFSSRRIGSIFYYAAQAIISPNISLTNFLCSDNLNIPVATNSITLNGYTLAYGFTRTTSIITLNNNASLFSTTINGNLLINSSYASGQTGPIIDNIVNGNVTSSSGVDRTIGGTINGNLTMQGSSYSTANNNGRVPITATVSGTTQFTSASPVTFTISGSAVWNINPSWSFTNPNRTFIFENTSRNDGTIPGLAQFNDSSSNNGTVTLSASFNDSSYNRGVVSGTATYNGLTGSNEFGYFVRGELVTAISIPITVTNNATFNGASLNQNTITGNCIFKNNSTNNGVIIGNVIFRNSAYNAKDISGTVTLDYDKGINGSSILGLV